MEILTNLLGVTLNIVGVAVLGYVVLSLLALGCFLAASAVNGWKNG